MHYSDQYFIKLAKEENIEYLSSLKDIKLHSYRYNEQKAIIEISLDLDDIPEINQYFKLLQKLKSDKYLIKFNIKNYNNSNQRIKDFIEKIIKISFNKFFINLKELYEKKEIFISYDINKDNWYLNFKNKDLIYDIKKISDVINKSLLKYGFFKTKIDDNFIEIKSFVPSGPTKEELLKLQINYKQETKTNTDFKRNNFKYKNSGNYSVLEINKIKKISFDEIDNKPISFNGEIYKSTEDKRENYSIYNYSFTNKLDAISGTKFIPKEQEEELFKKGDLVNVKGRLKKINRNGKENISIKIDLISKLEKKVILKTDKLEEKRVELNIKSKMNTMDSLLSIDEIIETVKQYNHSSFAISDIVSTQAFPELFHKLKKEKIKPIYGVSFNVIDENNKVFLNSYNNQKLLETEYVVFDIETTNLSAKVGELIEFGACIVKNGQIIKEEQFFVRTKKPISNFTSELTNITNEQILNQGIGLKDALDRIYDLLNNRVAVAHNANFDMNYIIQKFSELNKDEPNTTYIDTLMLSRLMFPENKKHALKDFCKNLDVLYDSDVAHRADYDANVLANAFINAIIKLEKINILDFDDLYNYLPENKNMFYSRINVYNNQITVLALNQEGLKELFKLISIASTQRMFGQTSKLFWSDIPKSKNLLIGSGGIRSELTEAMLYSSDQNIKELIKKLDYIEISRPSAFEYKLTPEGFTKEDINYLINDLIKFSKQQNKICVAVGDVRFKDEEDKIFYKTLIYSKGVGGSRHFAYDHRNSHNLKVPNFNFLTTQEMLDEFGFLNDEKLIKEIVITNTNKIADMVSDNIEVIKKDLYTPKFDDSKIKLPELVYRNAKEIYGEQIPEMILKRIEDELTPIIKYGFDVIYWISHILVKKSNDDGYVVGSRGSVGSSIIAFLSGISEVNPLPPHYLCNKCKYFEIVENCKTTSGFDLDDKDCPRCNIKLKKDGHTIPFETFLGFNADKVPDIDLNFSGENQGTIHNYVRDLFGEQHSFRAGTVSTIKEKTAFGFVKAANIDYNWGYSDDFMDYLSSKLIDIKRTTGQHPGGIIIIPKEYDVEDFTPVNFPSNDEASDWKTTHIDFEKIHDNVLKLDILGHVNPTAIRMLERLTGLNTNKDIPEKDDKLVSIFSSCQALGINPEDIGGEPTGALGLPEFGTDFVRKMLYEAKPESFADLTAISGLSHGEGVWSGNAYNLVKEQGKKLSEVISCRDDIMVFLISKGVPKKTSFDIMEKVRKGKGMTSEEEEILKSYNVPMWAIESMQKIKYMFPKAHAVAYVIMAWKIGWFKIYKPLEYYATFFTTRLSEFDLNVIVNDFNGKKTNLKILELSNQKDLKVNDNALLNTLEITRELYARGFKILNIDIEKSLANEWKIDYDKKALISPFSAIKGLGEAVASKVIKARDERHFTTKEDFKLRSGLNVTQYKIIEELGCLNHLDDTEQMQLFKI
ncbi:PolC-type DNA polymerase III [Mycoplasma leonicaptivi]|uniref:PolC-type DNA polymerase III n=1 Tax=Mycoplasma leonicaptivi TaxID=36742 RepID=UPI000485A4BD|nr:PolC-type DNA polymerase III [Mycoplasma leonicaptivi]